jgi:hypothetical protein
VLLPGDHVAVPGLRIYEMVRNTEPTHRIEIQSPRTRLVRLRLHDLAGKPLQNVSYACTTDSHPAERPGAAPSDDQGWIEERVPMHATRLTVHLLPSGIVLAHAISELDPLCDEDTKSPILSGVFARLLALGFDPGPASAIPTEPLRKALESFQAWAMQAKAPKGDLDAPTLSANASAQTSTTASQAA